MRLLITQGESTLSAQNEQLLDQIVRCRAAPKDTYKIEITYKIDSDGIHTVKVNNLETGETNTFKMRNNHTLTEIEK